VWILKQLFRLREKVQLGGEDVEKPFLDHLEDFRQMIIKMFVCILITTVLCFEYAPELMAIVRQPVDQVWTMHEESHLDSSIDLDKWEHAKTLAYTLPGLSESARQLALSQLPQEEANLAETLLLVRTAKCLPEEKRDGFIQQASAGRDEIQKLAKSLIETDAELAEGSGRGALKLMGAFQPGEAFMLSLRLSFYAGLIISFPFLLYFLLQFIVPGLLQNERRLLYKTLAIGFGLFLIGVSFAYGVVLPRVLNFFYTYSQDFGIANDWRIGYYISFAVQFVFMFGLGFELPVVVMPLVKLGVLSYDIMKRTRRYAIVAICILAAFITPTPDVPTMLLMAVPMYLLYELCIVLAWREQRKQQREVAEELEQIDREYGLHE
jgi:sec-independent protein translocase protein TatC